MKLAFDKFVQHVNAGLIKIEDVFANVEVIFGSANKTGTIVKGGCVRVGDRVFNLNPDEIKKFIVTAKLGLADYLKKLETGPFIYDGKGGVIFDEVHITKTKRLEGYLKMMATGPFSYNGKRVTYGEPATLIHRTAGVALPPVPDGKMIKEISSQFGYPLSTVLNVIKAYTGVPMEAVRTIEPEGQIENQQETGASTETLIQESGQDQGSNLGPDGQGGSTLRMDQEASGQVTEGPAKGS